MKTFYVIDVEFDTISAHIHRRYAVSSKRAIVDVHNKLEKERNLKFTWYTDAIYTADEIVDQIKSSKDRLRREINE